MTNPIDQSSVLLRYATYGSQVIRISTLEVTTSFVVVG